MDHDIKQLLRGAQALVEAGLIPKEVYLAMTTELRVGGIGIRPLEAI